MRCFQSCHGVAVLTVVNAFQANNPDRIEQHRLGDLPRYTVRKPGFPIASIEKHKVELERIAFDLVDCVESAVAVMAGAASAKGLDLGVFVDPTLNAGYLGDAARIRQVLLNLVGNAVKFTESGGVFVEVARARVERGRLRFEISDTGPGIPAQARARLFEKFTQADSSVTRRYGGTGLGLAICKQLVELMSGSIGIDAPVGEGSTFWFEIELENAPEDFAHSEKLGRSLEDVKVLIVDDLKMNREILRKQVAGCGVRTTCVEDGFAALRELERAANAGAPFDLVLLDQMMPGIAGEDVAATMRADPRLAPTRVVLLSSAGDQGLRKSSLQYLDAKLDKPIRRNDLLTCLAKVFGLPVAKESRIAPDTGRAGLSERQGQRLRVLLAEDNRINQKFAVAVLEKAGHRVEVVENGAQAVEAVRKGSYDVVLMDVQMPVLDGVGATREIRAMPGPKSAVPIIALTANAMSGDEETYLAAGMDDYVTKPISTQLLFEKLDRVANGGFVRPVGPPSAS